MDDSKSFVPGNADLAGLVLGFSRPLAIHWAFRPLVVRLLLCLLSHEANYSTPWTQAKPCGGLFACLAGVGLRRHCLAGTWFIRSNDARRQSQRWLANLAAGKTGKVAPDVSGPRHRQEAGDHARLPFDNAWDEAPGVTLAFQVLKGQGLIQGRRGEVTNRGLSRAVGDSGRGYGHEAADRSLR